MTTPQSAPQAQNWRPALLLLGIFVFALNLEQSVHELGHALALRAYGITGVRLVLHPVLGSRTVWQDTTDYAGFGVVDAAGPLLPLLLGLLLTIVLWRWRRAILLPLLLVLPLAAVSEGFSNAMQVLMQLPGSDAQRIVAAGVPAGVVLAVTVLLMGGGLVSFSLLLPLLGLAPTDSLRRRVVVLAGGMIPYWLLIVPLIAIFDPANISRGVVLLVFSLLVALAVAALYRPLAERLPRWFASAAIPVETRTLWVTSTLGGAALVLLLVAWN